MSRTINAHYCLVQINIFEVYLGRYRFYSLSQMIFLCTQSNDTTYLLLLLEQNMDTASLGVTFHMLESGNR